MPPGCQGPQRSMRLTDINPPRRTPYLVKASIVYWEQVGQNRHRDGSRGLMNR